MSDVTELPVRAGETPEQGGKMRNLLKIMVVAPVLLALAAGGAVADEPQLVGAPACKICHQKEKDGDQWGIWEKSAHAKAFETLASDEAKKIAAEKGIDDPQAAPECLRCHTTHHFLGMETVELAKRNKYEISEGVGCEVCHGPGSEYKSKKVMEDREAALAAGMQLHEGADHCLQCHNEESPTFKPFDFKERWAQIAHPIPEEEGGEG
jgi:hypothetical protein